MKNPSTLDVIYRGKDGPIDMDYTVDNIFHAFEVIMRGPDPNAITELVIKIRHSDGQAIVSGMDLLAGKG